MGEIKVGYRTLGGYDSKAYIDEETGVGIDKHSDVDVVLVWDEGLQGWFEKGASDGEQ